MTPELSEDQLADLAELVIWHRLLLCDGKPTPSPIYGPGRSRVTRLARGLVGVLPYFQVICRQVSREDWDRANESAKANMNDYLSIVGHSMDTFTADDLQELLAP